jgi:hypothetical protein
LQITFHIFSSESIANENLQKDSSGSHG